MDMKYNVSDQLAQETCMPFCFVGILIQGHGDLHYLQELQDIWNMVLGDIERNYVTENFCLGKDNS